MKLVHAALAAGLIACLIAPVQAAPARQKPKPEAGAAQSRDDIYWKCLAEAFRKFGWYYGARRVLYSDFAVTQTDYCVRNGGHF